VPEPGVVERGSAEEPLVPGLEVDRREAVTALGVVVEVPPVDVDPNASEVVDDPFEAAEVDHDHVVDRDARQRLDGLDDPGESAEGVGGIDAVAPGQVGCAPGVVDDEIAREGEQ